MLISAAESNIVQLIKKRNLLAILLLGLFSLNVLQGMLNIILSQNQGTTLVPIEINEAMWIGKKHPSPEYLKAIADYFASMFLNVTPSNAVDRINTVLKYVKPQDYAAMKKQLTDEAKLLEKHNQARFFTPISFDVNDKAKEVTIIGDETYMVGRTVVEVSRKRYKLAFVMDKSSTYLTKFQLIEDEVRS